MVVVKTFLLLNSSVSITVCIWFGGPGVGMKDCPLLRTDLWCSLRLLVEGLQMALLPVSSVGWYFLNQQFFYLFFILMPGSGCAQSWRLAFRWVLAWWC